MSEFAEIDRPIYRASGLFGSIKGGIQNAVGSAQAEAESFESIRDGVASTGSPKPESKRSLEPAKPPVLVDTPLGAVTLGEGGRKVLLAGAAVVALLLLMGRR